MKKVLLALAVISFFPAVGLAQASTAYLEAKEMLKEKNYFGVRDFVCSNAVRMTAGEKLVLEAYIGHAFNRPAASNRAITSFWLHYSKDAKDSLKLELLRLEQNNYARLFEYAQAYKVSELILSQYKHLLSPGDLNDIANTSIIWNSLIRSPKQQILIAENTSIKMKRDAAQLANIEVISNGISIDFIFDTGANFSTVTETTAQAFKMKLLEGRIEVGSITGTKVSSRLAICPAFSMGSITVRNAVFLVLPDTALAFSQINYQINGIIGFPVIESLNEVQLSRSDELMVPKEQSTGQVQNMALEFLTPIYLLNDEYFTFDTGATGTLLYSKYLRKHEKEITGEYTPVDLQFGGAGGIASMKGYRITYRPTIEGKKLELKNVEVIRESFGEDKDHFYGNIGQDLIKQFDKMIINFSGMFIRFQ